MISSAVSQSGTRQPIASRDAIYQAIDRERNYQDEQWGEGRSHSVSEWVLYIEYYLQQARMHLTTQTGELQGLDDMRKIAAMAVCCMEENGIVERGSFPSARS